jgi:hypothetical protein
MGYNVRLQKVDRPTNRSYYVNLPVVLAETCYPRLRMDPPTTGNWTHPREFNSCCRAATIYFSNALTN